MSIHDDFSISDENKKKLTSFIIKSVFEVE